MNQGQQKIKIPPPRGQLPMPDWQGRCCSVAKLYPTMCDPIAFSMPGFPVLHYLLVFAQTRPFSWWCHTTISSSAISFSSCPQSFPVTGSLPMSQLFTSGGQNTGASAPASVLPMNSQGWFPLELTGLISLQSKRFSRVFSNPTIQKHQFFGSRPSLSRSHIHTWLLKKP